MGDKTEYLRLGKASDGLEKINGARQSELSGTGDRVGQSKLDGTGDRVRQLELDRMSNRARYLELNKTSDSKASDGRVGDGGTDNGGIDNSRVDNTGVGDSKKSEIDVLEKSSFLRLMWISILVNFLMISSQLDTGKSLTCNKLFGVI